MSVDLCGSTAFKDSPAGLRFHENAPRWVSTFRSFYNDFPSLLAERYSKQHVGNITQGKCPEVWKAIGDELVFCGRVRSRIEVAKCIDVFVSALHEYRKSLKVSGSHTEKLDLKGAAWLAAFPAQNLAVRLYSGADDPEYLSMTEGLEAAADEKPFEHDFLGKAIDTGFRIGASAEPARFAISVQLASVLLSIEAGDASSHAVRVDIPKVLKGVNSGAPYPSLYIDTMDGFTFKDVRLKERALFGSNGNDAESIKSYIEAYCKAVGTEEIALPMQYTEDTTHIALPPSYSELKKSLDQELLSERDRGAENQDTGEDPLSGQAAEFMAPELNPRA